MASSSASGPVSVCDTPDLDLKSQGKADGKTNYLHFLSGVLDREGNARKVVNCSCVVVKDWGEESQERSIILNYFQTSQ